MTALGPVSYIWLKYRAMIHISIHTPLCWKVTLQAGNRMEGVHLKTHEIWWQTTLP